MTHVLDASAIIGHLDPGDAHHEPASQALVGAAGTRLVAHPLTIGECLVGAVRAGQGEGVRAAIADMGVELFAVDDDSPLRLAGLRVETGLRMPDCCVLDAALQRGANLIAFDAGLTAAARRLGLLVIPAPSSAQGSPN